MDLLVPAYTKAGKPGSPILALKTLVNRSDFHKYSKTEFVFMFVEADPGIFDNLATQIDKLWTDRKGGKPPNVEIIRENKSFAHVVDEIVDYLRHKDQALAPTLAFLDPFGWTGAPMSTIKDLVSLGRCEVLFNFMYDSVSRFVTVDEVAQSFNALFGTDDAEYRQYARLHGEPRKIGLRDYYSRRLKNECGFKYVRTFEVVDIDRGRTAYFLVFGTRSLRGLEKMKDAMWSLDPVQGIRFTGFAGDQKVLFAPTPDKGPLRLALVNHFAGRTVTVNFIEKFVIEETDYKSSHYKSELKMLEKTGLIECTSIRQRPLTYPSGTILRFKRLGDDSCSSISSNPSEQVADIGGQGSNIEESIPKTTRLPGF